MLISFALLTGCRAGEILGAAWNHIDWESGEFRVRRAFREGHFHEPKTRTSYRSIALPGFLLKELKVWLACPQNPHDLIFPNLDGRPMSYWNLMARGFHPALKRGGIRRIRFHDLRHTFASLMISNGEDIVRCRDAWGTPTPRSRSTLTATSAVQAGSDWRSARRPGVWKQNRNRSRCGKPAGVSLRGNQR